MASFFKYLFRALKAMSTSTPPSTAEPGTESYNKLIFPESLTNNQSTPGTWGVNCPGFFLDYAKKCAVDHGSVESIRVTSLSYHKEKSRGRHEFLVVKVEDTEHKQSNFLQIDRCPPEGEELAFPPKPSDNKACTFRLAEDSDDLPATTVITNQNSRGSALSFASRSGSSGSVSDSFGNRVAQDRVSVSPSGTPTSVNGNKSKRLATVYFRTKKPTLVELLIIAETVSKSRPLYHLFRSQCYWYAFTIWEVLRLEFGDCAVWPDHHGSLGRHAFLPWIEWHKRSLKGTQAQAAQGDLKYTHASLAERYQVALTTFMEESREIVNAREKKARDQEDAARLREEHLHAQAKNKELEENALRDQAKKKELEDGMVRAQEEKAQAQEDAARAQENAVRAQEDAARAQEDAAQAREEKLHTQAKNEELEEGMTRAQEANARTQARNKELEENALRHQAKQKEWEEGMARAHARIMELEGKLTPVGGQGD